MDRNGSAVKWQNGGLPRGEDPLGKLEWVVDVDLFLSTQNHWAEDSPHRLMILHEMFLHATAKGWKEAERMICRGFWQYMPKLDPRADLSAIQLVYPMIGRRELLDLYLKGYRKTGQGRSGPHSNSPSTDTSSTPRKPPTMHLLSPPCLNRWRFMPPPQSIYASRDIREIPREKAVAYARALQYYAEQSDPQKRCQPCLLAESVVELREEIGFYLAFQDEEVFWGLDLPKEEGAHPIIAAAAITEMEDITDIPEVSPALEASSKYAGWGTILHPT